MSLFDFFHRSKQNASNQASDNQALAVNEQAKLVDHSLFVDEQEPELELPAKKQPNAVELFLEQKFEWQGYNEGYASPEMEYLAIRLKLMRAEFRLAADKLLDAKRSELTELRMHVIKTAGISPRLEAQLNEKIRLMEVNIHELDTQKILAVEDEGLVASAVHAYKLGFIRGVERYQQEKLFAGSTGLFNQ